jgi:hypothetical protein
MDGSADSAGPDSVETDAADAAADIGPIDDGASDGAVSDDGGDSGDDGG